MHLLFLIMRTLSSFLSEALIIESSSDFKLLKTYEDAKDYLNKRPNILMKLGISLEDIKVLYDIQAKYNKTTPIVGCYKSKNTIAMRRWIDSKLNEWREQSGNNIISDKWFWTKIPGVYAGPHNTNLKEDGSYNPSAEDMELVVAFGVNKLVEPELDDVKNIKFVCNDKTNKESQKQENLLNYYQDEYKFINNCANVLSSLNKKLYKPVTNGEKVTKEWIEIGRYKETGDTPNASPKTDLISEDGKYKISLKKANGSQLMSGSYNESVATIMSAAHDTLHENDIKALKDILSTPWIKLKGNQKGIVKQKESGSPEIKKAIYNSENSAKYLNEYLNNLFNTNKEFKKALLYEAMTGEKKFGKRSRLAANYVFVWSQNSQENKLYTAQEYLSHIMNNKIKIEIGWKTGGSTSIQALRIITK
jgi:hypothetical protein